MLNQDEIDKIIDDVYEHIADRFPEKEDIISLVCGDIRHETVKAIKRKGGQ